jgi:hypothetical protein
MIEFLFGSPKKWTWLPCTNFCPIADAKCPLAFQDVMPGMCMEKSAITDVAVILPVKELESMLFLLSGAENVFSIRYAILNGVSSLLFCCYLVEPLGVYLFITLITLSQYLRKALYLQLESVVFKKIFCL